MATKHKKPVKPPPSFFCILLNDFTHTLKIPCEFVKEYLEGEVIEKPILETEGSTKTWAVEMKKIDQDYFFKMGWSDFVQENGLENGDFLLFWLISDSTFFVTIYDPTCCEKPFNTSIPSSPNKNTCREETIVRMEKETNGANKTKPRCEAKLTKSTIYRLNLPIGFVRETGILLKERSTMLRDEEGREWRVETCLRRHVFELTNGWRDFLNGNGIKESDVCSFEFCREEGNLIDVRVLNRNQTMAGSTQNIRARTKTRRRGRESRASKTKNPCFINRINKSSRYTMGLGLKFVRETGILLKKNRTVLRDEEGRTWEMDTCLRKHGSTYELTNGWNRFRKDKGLKRWDVCSFEFCKDEGNLINFRVLSRNGGRKPRTQ